MANIITRLVMDSAQYSGGLEKAQKSLDKYVQKNVSLENVAGKLVGTIGKFAGGIGLAMGAQEAFNKIIDSSQTLTDEYGRTMEAAKVSVDTFFNSLAFGDFSIFTDSISQAITSAREFYNELDRLGSIQVFQDTSLMQIRLEMEKAKGVLYDKKSTKEQKNAATAQLKDLNQRLLDQSKILSDQAIKTYYADLRKKINSYGVTGSKESMNYLINKYFDTFTNYEDATNQFLKLKEKADSLMKTKYEFTKAGVRYDAGTEESAESKAARKEPQYVVLRAVSEIGDKALKEAKNYERLALTEQINAQTQINSNLRRIGKTEGGGSGANKKDLGVAVGIDKIDLMIKTAIDNTSDNKLDNEIYKAIEGDKKLPVLLQPVQEIIEESRNEGPKEGEDVALEGLRSRISMYDLAQQKIAEYKDMLSYANEGEKGYLQSQIDMWEEYANKIGIAVKKGENLDIISGGLGQIGSALSSTGNDWLSYIGNSMSAIGSLIQVIGDLTSAKFAASIAEQAGKPFPYNLVAITGTIAAITSAMGSIRSFGNFAEGGVVGGTNYQDGITARVSSGEMFINESDQKRLYDSIHTGNLGGGGSGRTVVTGEQIVIAGNNWGKRTGRGELVFSKK